MFVASLTIKIAKIIKNPEINQLTVKSNQLTVKKSTFAKASEDK